MGAPASQALLTAAAAAAAAFLTSAGTPPPPPPPSTLQFAQYTRAPDTASPLSISLTRTYAPHPGTVAPAAWFSPPSASAEMLPLPESPAMRPKRLQTFPESLDGDEGPRRVQKPKTASAGRCVQKCVATCIRGGAGAPGEGPLNVRRPLVVFKEEFRSRKYCLSECVEICNLIPEGEDGP